MSVSLPGPRRCRRAAAAGTRKCGAAAPGPVPAARRFVRPEQRGPRGLGAERGGRVGRGAERAGREEAAAKGVSAGAAGRLPPPLSRSLRGALPAPAPFCGLGRGGGAGGAAPRPAGIPHPGREAAGTRTASRHRSVSAPAALAVSRGRGFVAAAPGGGGSALFCVCPAEPPPLTAGASGRDPHHAHGPWPGRSRVAAPRRPGLSSRSFPRRCRDRNFLEGLAVFCRDEERRASPRDAVPAPGWPCGRECEALVAARGPGRAAGRPRAGAGSAGVTARVTNNKVAD